MTENENFYDAEIAPALLEIGKKLQDRGMSMVVSVEYDRDDRGTTSLLDGNSGLAIVMLSLCAQCGENIDDYFISLKKYADKNGIDTSGSIVMNLLRDKP